MASWEQESRFSTASGQNLPYVVLQVTLKEKLFGTGSGNLTDLERVINTQAAKGYRLHSMSTTNSDSMRMIIDVHRDSITLLQPFRRRQELKSA